MTAIINDLLELVAASRRPTKSSAVEPIEVPRSSRLRKDTVAPGRY